MSAEEREKWNIVDFPDDQTVGFGLFHLGVFLQSPLPGLLSWRRFWQATKPLRGIHELRRPDPDSGDTLGIARGRDGMPEMPERIKLKKVGRKQKVLFFL